MIDSTGGWVAPATAVLAQAEEDFASHGHENRGFLSASHGFLPREEPRAALAPSHRPWDDLAAGLPKLWRAGVVRRELEALPVLPADRTALSDADLCRASTLLSLFAHAHVRVDPEEASPLPPGVAEPWRVVSARLGRRAPHLSYSDLILYNWRLRDPRRDDPMRVENLELLVPTVDNQEEQVFYLTQVEIAAQCTPLVGGAVRAQQAVLRDDPRALEAELLRFVACLRHVTEVSFMKIDPNPLSATHVDPVLWANLVAPFAVPIHDDVAGPSGTSSPVFHLLDAVLGRRHFATYLGEEAAHLRPWFPPHVQAFVQALEQVSVREYVQQRGDSRLRGAFSSALDAYAGEHSFLSVHRRKVYGYLEVAFKAGRQVTIGGFTGAFEDRAWKEVDAELEHARVERSTDVPAAPQIATLVERCPAAADPQGRVHGVALDITGSGLVYEPGDRCQVWVVNRPELIDRTAAALRATGDEPVPLTRAWREALGARGLPAADTLPLRDVLRLAKLRPLLRSVGKALLAVTASKGLDRILEAYEEDQWELWETLGLLGAEGYDPARLVTAGLWRDEALTRILPPEPPRTYSIACAADPADGPFPARLELTVGRLEYPSARSGPSMPTRYGTASHHLTALAEKGERFAVRVVHPLRFHPPRDPRRPTVMFAGGTGIAPFRGFLQQRAGEPAAAPSWLLVAARTVGDLPHRAELEDLARRGVVELRVAVSDEDVDVRFDGRAGRLTVAPGSRKRIQDLMLEPDVAALLWELLRPAADGGREGVLYVCGRAGFAHAVLETLTGIVAQQLDDAHTGARSTDAEAAVRRAFAEGRIMQDTFTTFAPATAPGVLGAGRYDASEVVLHNDDEHGFWLVVNGAVYDVTGFRHIHPGGPRIVDEYAGTDATREWEAVGHDRSSEVDAMLSMYKIGAVRRLDLGTAWGVALGASGVEYVSLRDLFRSWVRLLYLTTEMQNALRNDLGYLPRPLVRGDDPARPSPLRMQLVANTHMRFLRTYFDGLLRSETLQHLWAATIGLTTPDEDVLRLRRALDAVCDSPEAQAVEAHALAMRAFHRTLALGAEAATWARVTALMGVVAEAGEAFLAAAKAHLRVGVQAFEQHEARTTEHGAEVLHASLLGLADAAAAYHARFLADVTRIGGGVPFAPRARQA